jgi:transcriptional regulator with XRE-family HTH domain
MNRLEKAQLLGEILRTFLKSKGWSARDLTRSSDVDPSSISAYLQGITFPEKENREKLAKAMQISSDELDAQLGLTVAKPKSKVDEICRDIRLLNDDEFAQVADTVFERISRKLREGKKPGRKRTR